MPTCLQAVRALLAAERPFVDPQTQLDLEARRGQAATCKPAADTPTQPARKRRRRTPAAAGRRSQPEPAADAAAVELLRRTATPHGSFKAIYGTKQSYVQEIQPDKGLKLVVAISMQQSEQHKGVHLSPA